MLLVDIFADCRIYRLPKIGIAIVRDISDHRNLLAIDRRWQAADSFLIQGISRSPESIRQREHANRNTGHTESKQGSAAKPVNQPHGDKGKDKIDKTDEHRLHERGIRPDSRLFENHRRVKEHRVDAGNLLENADRNAYRQHQLQAWLKQCAD